ncbi:MAG: peptide-methionine (R)-S-oxide reductase MsrB [Burkholderiales bacterium]
MNRRQLLIALGALPISNITRTFAATERSKSVEELQKNWKALLPTSANVSLSLEPVKKTRDEWKKILSPESFDVLREEGTERAGTSALNNEKRVGVFVCAGCELPLFTSEMKYDSGTGWPSFFTAISGHTASKKDYKLVWPRTEYHCIRCGGHQGHMFNDGPQPGGQRWCNNGVALKFIAAENKS